MPAIRRLDSRDECAVRAFLLESAELYPDIDLWFDRKVCPGLHSGTRIGFVVEERERLAGLVIAKRGKRAKLCSLRVHEPFRHRGWGSALVRRAVAELISGGTEEMYVTVSEAVDPRHRQFFEGLGFAQCGRAKDKYVKGLDEFVYTWAMPQMVRFLREPLDDWPDEQAAPWLPLPDMIMSLKPEYARLILDGHKSVEFRRRFSRRHVGARVLFYVSRPVRSFMFTARISDVARSSTEQLWADYCQQGGVDRDTYDAYFAGAGSGYALGLTEVRPLREGLPLADAVRKCPGLSPPQSYKMVKQTPGLLALCQEHLREEGEEWALASSADGES